MEAHNIHNLYALRDNSTEQVTGLFLYKTDEEAIMHTEYAMRELFLEEDSKAKDTKLVNATHTDLLLVAEMDLQSGTTGGRNPKKIFSGRKFLISLEKHRQKKEETK